MMKKIASTFVLLNFAFQVLAQEDVLKNVKAGFKSGNATVVSSHLSTRVELALESDKKILRKEKAVQVLQDFFLVNKPKDFQLLHQGASKEGLKFYIGEYISVSGTYRVLIYLRHSLIEKIDISKE